MEEKATSVPASHNKRSRREQRQLIIEFLYMWQVQREVELNTLLDTFFTEKNILQTESGFVYPYIQGITARCEHLDEIIGSKAKNWTFDRIAKMDLAILRLAVYELIFCSEIPPAVVINEAIEISKIYSSPESKRFVNGLLDKIVKENLNSIEKC